MTNADVPSQAKLVEIMALEVLQEQGWWKLPEEDLPAGYAAAIVHPGTPEPEAVALAYAHPGHSPVLLITPRLGHEREDVEALLDAVRCVSVPGPSDSRECTATIAEDLPDMPQGLGYTIAAFIGGRYIGYRDFNAGDVEDEFVTMLAQLPRWMVKAIHRATRCAPDQCYSVAYAALAGCGHGEEARQELARKAVRLATALAVGRSAGML